MANIQLFGGRTELPATSTSPTPGEDQGLYISIQLGSFHDVVDMFANWFRHREEIVLVDMGTSDKRELGFVIIEWAECEIDQLFIDILKTEEAIENYTIYSREV